MGHRERWENHEITKYDAKGNNKKEMMIKNDEVEGVCLGITILSNGYIVEVYRRGIYKREMYDWATASSNDMLFNKGYSRFIYNFHFRENDPPSSVTHIISLGLGTYLWMNEYLDVKSESCLIFITIESLNAYYLFSCESQKEGGF